MPARILMQMRLLSAMPAIVAYNWVFTIQTMLIPMEYFSLVYHAVKVSKLQKFDKVLYRPVI
jgi:hypothetical protein